MDTKSRLHHETKRLFWQSSSNNCDFFKNHSQRMMHPKKSNVSYLSALHYDQTIWRAITSNWKSRTPPSGSPIWSTKRCRLCNSKTWTPTQTWTENSWAKVWIWLRKRRIRKIGQSACCATNSSRSWTRRRGEFANSCLCGEHALCLGVEI